MHDLNPSRWGNAAKLWELMRRNHAYRRRVRRLLQVANSRTPSRNGLLNAERFLSQMEQSNCFAALAARWFFEPVVHRRRKKRRKLSEVDQNRLQSCLMDSGWQPDLPASQSRAIRKRVYERLTYIPNTGGAPFRIGPRLNEADAHELQNWLAEGRAFSLDLPWPETPLTFQRQFSHLWKTFEPTEDLSDGLLAPHESHFFQDWSLMELLTRFAEIVKLGNQLILDEGASDEVCFTKGGGAFVRKQTLEAYITKTEQIRALQFAMLQRDFRVFCFPKYVRLTAEQIRHTFGNWADEIVKDQKRGKQEIFGTGIQWDIFLTVEDEQKSGKRFDEALKASFHKLFLRLELKGDHPLQKVVFDRHMKEARSSRWASWKNDYLAMDDYKHSNGWIQRVFPKFRI